MATIPTALKSWPHCRRGSIRLSGPRRRLVLPSPTNRSFCAVVAVDAAGQEGWDQTPLVVPSGRCSGNLTINADLTGQTFFAGQPLPNISWSGNTNNFCTTVTPHIVLEADGHVLSADGFGNSRRSAPTRRG